jgi:hypothetical protein
MYELILIVTSCQKHFFEKIYFDKVHWGGRVVFIMYSKPYNLNLTETSLDEDVSGPENIKWKLMYNHTEKQEVFMHRLKRNKWEDDCVLLERI